MHAIVSRLTQSGRERLKRCREAECRLMREVDGATRCLGMGGGKCEWLAKWAASLNGDEEFPNGTSECSHWPADWPDLGTATGEGLFREK